MFLEDEAPKIAVRSDCGGALRSWFRLMFLQAVRPSLSHKSRKCDFKALAR